MAFDRSAPNPSELSVGTHLLEIIEAKEGLSKSSGNLQWTVTACSVEDRTKTIRFWLPLAGKMRWNTSLCLDVLGFPGDAKVEAYNLIARRFYGAIKHEEFRGEMQAKLDERAEGSRCGMWSQDAPPEHVATAEAQASNLFVESEPKTDPLEDSETPF
jgi:hypothetical protein